MKCKCVYVCVCGCGCASVDMTSVCVCKDNTIAYCLLRLLFLWLSLPLLATEQKIRALLRQLDISSLQGVCVMYMSEKQSLARNKTHCMGQLYEAEYV